MTRLFPLVFLFLSCASYHLSGYGQPIRLHWQLPGPALVEITSRAGERVLRAWMRGGDFDTLIHTSDKKLQCQSTVFSVESLPFQRPFAGNSEILAAPQGIVWNGKKGLRSRFAVSDPANKRIFWLDPTGQEETWIQDRDLFARPVGLALGTYGDVWILDTGIRSLLHYDYQGKLTGRMDWKDNPLIRSCAQIAMDRFGKLLLLDPEQGSLIKLDPATGQKIKEIRTLGWGQGFLQTPSAFCETPDNYFIVDAGNSRLARVPKSGGKSMTFDLNGLSALADLENGCLAGYDQNDKSLWLLDEQNQRFLKFPRLLRSLGGIAWGDGILAVTDPASGCVFFYQISRKTENLPVTSPTIAQ